jgi:hypothetical protein
MYCAGLVASVLAGVEGTLEELTAGVRDRALELELSSIAGSIAELRLSVYPNSEADTDEALGPIGADAPAVARHQPTP